MYLFGNNRKYEEAKKVKDVSLSSQEEDSLFTMQTAQYFSKNYRGDVKIVTFSAKQMFQFG